jgi:hypothetical protein
MAADALTWADRLRRQGVEARVIPKLAPPELEVLVAATVQVRSGSMERAFALLSAGDGALHLRRPNASAVPLQDGEVLLQRGDQASYVGGEAGLSFWRFVGWTIWLVFLPVLLPFLALKYWQRRREFAQLAQTPGVEKCKGQPQSREATWGCPLHGSLVVHDHEHACRRLSRRDCPTDQSRQTS